MKGRSFTLDNVKFNLYDHAFFDSRSLFFYIGKIIKIWEVQKMVEVAWFFHPEEIQDYLGDYKPLDNEIFLAYGTDDADGVYDLNRLESIAGKCTVVCTSKDPRNPQPSKEDISRADYVFSRVFDVETKTLSDILPDKIALRDIRFFLNRKEDIARSSALTKPPINPLPRPEKKRQREEERTDENGKASKRRQIEIDRREISAQRGAKLLKEDEIRNERAKLLKEDEIRNERAKFGKEMGRVKETGGKDREMWKVKENGGKDGFRDKGKGSIPSGSDKGMKPPLPKRKETNGDLKNENKWKVSIPVPAPIEVPNNERKMESPIERRLVSPVEKDKRKWFKLPWGDQLEKAAQDGTLVFFENFDPSYSSSDIQDLILHATGQNCKVKSAMQYSYMDPTYGEAYAIFPNKEAANDVVDRLNKEFLILPHGRPLYCSKGLLEVPKKPSSLVGHLAIDKLKILMKEEMKKAVSTSHCSQANTIEFDFAMEWFLKLEKYERSRSVLNEAILRERRKKSVQK